MKETRKSGHYSDDAGIRLAFEDGPLCHRLVSFCSFVVSRREREGGLCVRKHRQHKMTLWVSEVIQDTNLCVCVCVGWSLPFTPSLGHARAPEERRSVPRCLNWMCEATAEQQSKSCLDFGGGEKGTHTHACREAHTHTWRS